MSNGSEKPVIRPDDLGAPSDDLFTRVSAENPRPDTVIVVEEPFCAVAVRDGHPSDVLGAGTYPVGDASRVDVVYMSREARLTVSWGTRSRMSATDAATGVRLELGANGRMEVGIARPDVVYRALMGRDRIFTSEKLSVRLASRVTEELCGMLDAALATAKLSYADLQSSLPVLSDALRKAFSELFEKEYGLRVYAFSVRSVYIPESCLKLMRDARRAPDVTYCPDCGREYASGERYCAACGARLVSAGCVCAHCGTVNVESAVFCSHCGKKL